MVRWLPLASTREYIAQVGGYVGTVSVGRCFDGKRRDMTGDASQGAAPRGRYMPRGHPVSWLMLVVTTGAILITSIDRAILPTVLPASSRSST